MVDIPIDIPNLPAPSDPVGFGVCALGCVEQYRHETSVRTDGGDESAEASTSSDETTGEGKASPDDQSNEAEISPKQPTTDGEPPLDKPATEGDAISLPEKIEEEVDSGKLSPKEKRLLICIGGCWTTAQ